MFLEESYVLGLMILWCISYESLCVCVYSLCIRCVYAWLTSCSCDLWLKLAASCVHSRTTHVPGQEIEKSHPRGRSLNWRMSLLPWPHYTRRQMGVLRLQCASTQDVPGNKPFRCFWVLCFWVLWYRCMFLVSLMVPMYVSYEPYAASTW